MSETLTELHLAHFGIKGQRWGVRRFQEENGEYTEEGRRRYGIGLEEANRIFEQSKSEYNNAKTEQEKSRASAKMAFAKRQLQDEKILDKINNSNKSKRQLDLEEKYKQQGMDEKEAAIAAYKRNRTEKIIAAASVTAIAAVGSYIAYKHWDKNADRFIKKGTVFQNVSENSNKGVKDAFYASTSEQDKARYRGVFGGGQLQGRQFGAMMPWMQDTNKKIYSMNTTASKAMKVAGRSTSKKTVDELLKDSDFKKRLTDQLDTYSKGKGSAFGPGGLQKETGDFLSRLKSGQKLTKNDYDTFNRMLVDHNDNNQKVIDKFYSKLKEKGYDAVRDINDVDYSGYNTKSAMIVFNSKNLGKTTVTQLSNSQLEKEYSEQYKKLYDELQNKQLKELLKPKKTKDAIKIGAYALGLGVMGKSYINYTKNEQNKIHNEQIEKYKKEHPATKLSDKEILKRIYGYS